MYSTKIIQRNIESFEAKSGIKLVRWDISRTREWVEHLNERKKKADEQKKTLELTKEEREFIRNELVMAVFDYLYHAERYHFLLLDGGGLGLFNAWGSQDIMLEHMRRIEEKMYEALDAGLPVDGILMAWHKARQLGACLAPSTRVLTSDLSWVPIGNVLVGQKLVAVDDESQGRGGRKLRVAVVEATNKVHEPAFRVRMNNGTEFVATGPHRFLCRDRGSLSTRWRAVSSMRVGDCIRFVVRPWGVSSYEDGWFGGILDGEGTVRSKSSGGVEGCMSQVAGDVLNRAEDYLRSRGYSFRDEVDRREAGDTSKLGNQVVHKLVVDRIDEVFHLVGQTRPARFLKSYWWEGKALPGRGRRGVGGTPWPSIISIEPLASQMMIDLQTSTGTFVAEGLVSHNSLLAQSLLAHRATTTPHNRCLVASVDDLKTVTLFSRTERILDHLPWWFAPKVTDKVKSQHLIFGELDSSVILQDSKQMSGVGQGEQFEVSHLTECASWAYPDEIEHNFFPTIPQSVRALSILESTAQGRGNWWHDFCTRLQRGDTRRWNFVFVPWYAEPKKYRAAVPAGWVPATVTKLHARMVESTSHLYCFGKRVVLEKEQLYWWESTRDEYQQKGKLNIFLTNYCSTPNESFQHTGVSPFQTELLEKLRAGTSVPVTRELIRVEAG